jgi:magnesium-protoporphyrin O-methyltransferase
MANEAARRAKELDITDANFYTSDLESVSGKYNTVTCVDVAIHYPTEKMSEMVKHLCSLADNRVIISFAPKTWYYVFLKKIGELFPGPSKTTRAYLHEEEAVRNALKQAGFEVTREEMTATNFYFSRLLEAKRV